MKPACALFANQTAMYEVIPEIVDNMPSFFSILFSFIGTAGFVVPLIFALRFSFFFFSFFLLTQINFANQQLFNFLVFGFIIY